MKHRSHILHMYTTLKILLSQFTTTCSPALSPDFTIVLSSTVSPTVTSTALLLPSSSTTYAYFFSSEPSNTAFLFTYMTFLYHWLLYDHLQCICLRDACHIADRLECHLLHLLAGCFALVLFALYQFQ